MILGSPLRLAAREIASTIEPLQDGRIFIELGRVLTNALRLL